MEPLNRPSLENRGARERSLKRIVATAVVSLALVGAGTTASVEADPANAADGPAPTSAKDRSAGFAALSRGNVTASDLAADWARGREEIAEAEVHRRSHLRQRRRLR